MFWRNVSCLSLGVALLLGVAVWQAQDLAADIPRGANTLSASDLTKYRGGATCYDCTKGQEQTRVCDTPFPGCAESICGSFGVVAVGTGNSYRVCRTVGAADGVCKDEALVHCMETYRTTADGDAAPFTRCSTVSWNCVSGKKFCRECTKGDVVPNGDEDKWYKDYKCE